MNWRKSSYSGQGSGNCIEVTDHDSRVIVRDTKDRTGPILRFSADAWRRFADHVKADASLASDLAKSVRGAALCVRVAPLAMSPDGPGLGSAWVGEPGRAPLELRGDRLGLVRAADQGADFLLLRGEPRFQVHPARQVKQPLRRPDGMGATAGDGTGQLQGGLARVRINPGGQAQRHGLLAAHTPAGEGQLLGDRHQAQRISSTDILASGATMRMSA